MCCGDDYPTCDVWVEEWRKARKRYTCFECRGVIEPGSRYLFLKGLWDGDWGKARMCGHCGEALKRANAFGVQTLLGGNVPHLDECMTGGPCSTAYVNDDGQLAYASSLADVQEFGAMAGLRFALLEQADAVRAAKEKREEM